MCIDVRLAVSGSPMWGIATDSPMELLQTFCGLLGEASRVAATQNTVCFRFADTLGMCGDGERSRTNHNVVVPAIWRRNIQIP